MLFAPSSYTGSTRETNCIRAGVLRGSERDCLAATFLFHVSLVAFSSKADFTFDGLSRLTEVSSSATTVSYGYDPDGRRVFQSRDGTDTWFVMDGLSCVMELDTNKKPTMVITPGVCKTRLDLTPPLTESYLYDGLGSVVNLTDAMENITQTYLYDPFGGTRNVKGDPGNRYRFVGLAADDATGLTYMNARWYDAAPGRFLSRDPVPGNREDTQSLDLYPYVSNNPLNLTDVMGLNPNGPDTCGPEPDLGTEAHKNWVKCREGSSRAAAEFEEAQRAEQGAALARAVRGAGRAIARAFRRATGAEASGTAPKGPTSDTSGATAGQGTQTAAQPTQTTGTQPGTQSGPVTRRRARTDIDPDRDHFDKPSGKTLPAHQAHTHEWEEHQSPHDPNKWNVKSKTKRARPATPEDIQRARESGGAEYTVPDEGEP